MSIKIMSHVWDRSPSSGSELLILLALADHANDDGYCWPSVTRIAHKARISERQAQRILRSLEESGQLQVRMNPGRKRTNYYRIVIGDTHDTFPNGDMDDMQKVTHAVEKVTPKAVKGDIVVSPESSIEPSRTEPSVETSIVSGTKPYDLLLAMCEQLNVDPGDLPPRDRSRQLAVAKRLLSDKATPQDITNITRWLQGQAWITGGIDMFLIEKQKGQWILAGKPDGTQRPLTATQSHGKSKRDTRYLDPAELLARAAELEEQERDRSTAIEDSRRALD